ncbi:MAG: MBL fold metallo-hydrolase [Deltaproteobacteria bacterium]|nr:MBL fold metallo-hydrolase [Deltaproteobacteria bacterium]MBW2480798.1 MBL fold metallo-hydrolase [Deltaproteobacteria bacterium]
MIELKPNIFYIPGENKSRFPFCACLYLRGKNLRVLIDAGMGTRNLAPIKGMGIDLLILTHCHIDHRLNCQEIARVPVWCHTSDAGYLKDRDYFLESMGFKRSGLDLTGLFDFDKKAFSIETDHRLNHGERIDLGGITLEAIHAPGHTPGHTAFLIPEHGLIFSGDIDLTPFGPFYGHDFADINEFLASIDKLKHLEPKVVASGHAGPFSDNLHERFGAYAQVIHDRDQKLLEKLSRPKSIEHFKGRHLYYNAYPDFPDLIRWFELVHIEKHLSRLESMGKVRNENNKWIKI